MEETEVYPPRRSQHQGIITTGIKTRAKTGITIQATKQYQVQK
jgi:hypothetical protein